ncbi:MAG: hypothetical protein JW966_04860, partial [Anaerolineae bacterium]|nr:hypothetical protein [Anaerolineae bacterium]
MSDDIRHDGDNEQIDADAIQPDSVPEPASSQVDPFVEVLRDLPRMRAEEDAGAKPFVPPPPMLVRMGAVTQGCGGVILTLMSLPMLLVAFAFGFYLWGPGLIVASGVVMLLGTPGLWRGNRLSIFIGFGAALVALVVTYMWRYFVLAVAILSPLGAMVEVIYSLGVMVGALVIVGILILMIFGLLYWRRLHPPTSRALMVWAAILILLIAVPLVSSVFEQQNRRDWLETHRDDWTAQAQIDSLVLGANSNVALGYTFASSEPADAEKLFET